MKRRRFLAGLAAAPVVAVTAPEMLANAVTAEAAAVPKISGSFVSIDKPLPRLLHPNFVISGNTIAGDIADLPTELASIEWDELFR